MAPSVETLWAVVAAEAGATVGVNKAAVGFKTPVGLKQQAPMLAESSLLTGLNS